MTLLGRVLNTIRAAFAAEPAESPVPERGRRTVHASRSRLTLNDAERMFADTFARNIYDPACPSLVAFVFSCECAEISERVGKLWLAKPKITKWIDAQLLDPTKPAGVLFKAHAEAKWEQRNGSLTELEAQALGISSARLGFEKPDDPEETAETHQAIPAGVPQIFYGPRGPEPGSPEALAMVEEWKGAPESTVGMRILPADNIHEAETDPRDGS